MAKDKSMCTSPWGEGSNMASYMNKAMDTMQKTINSQPPKKIKESETVVGNITNLAETKVLPTNVSKEIKDISTVSLNDTQKKLFKKFVIDLSDSHDLINLDMENGIAQFKSFRIIWGYQT